MTTKPVVPRELARRDVEEAVDYYVQEAGERVALGFIDALEAVYDAVSRQAAAGSPRYAHELQIPGLRVWSLRRYPHLVFYVEQVDHIDVWRVLHGQRDIPTWTVGEGA